MLSDLCIRFGSEIRIGSLRRRYTRLLYRSIRVPVGISYTRTSLVVHQTPQQSQRRHRRVRDSVLRPSRQSRPIISPTSTQSASTVRCCLRILGRRCLDLCICIALFGDHTSAPQYENIWLVTALPMYDVFILTKFRFSNCQPLKFVHIISII